MYPEKRLDDLEDYSDLIDEDAEEELTPREKKKRDFLETKRLIRKLSYRIDAMTEAERLEYSQMLDDVERIACELSLAVFFRCAWPHMDTAEYNHNWHFDIIGDEVEALVDGQQRRLLVNMPPRCGKSLLLTVAFMAWTWIQPDKGPLSGPQVKFITASYAQSLSFEHSNLARKLMRSPWFTKNWGARFKFLDDRDAIGYYENDKGGYRLSTSVGTGITGRGADCVAEGTLIRTPYGTKKVEDVVAGDNVLCFDHSRGEVLISRVLASQSRKENEWYEICSSSGSRFSCTGNHPVYVEGRGYVAAQNVRVGDRLVGVRRQESFGKFDLRDVRGKHPETTLRSAEDTEKRPSGCLLQSFMLSRTPRGKKQRFLPALRQSKISRFLVLFGRMQKRRTYGETHRKAKAPHTTMSALCRNVYKTVQYLLLPRVCERRSFAAYVGVSQFQVQGVGKVFEPVSTHGAPRKNTRQPFLHCVRREGFKEICPSEKTASTPFNSAGTSYRREHTEQCTGEFNNFMQRVPQEAPPWNFETVASVTYYRGKKNRFYDIQVEKYRNFFSDGILTHNCIIIDDPSDTAAIVSESERNAVINWYRQSLSNRFNDPKTGAMVLVMQRQAVDDLSGYFLDNEYELWRHIVFRMRFEQNPPLDYDPRTEEGELLWPSRVPASEVDKQEKITGSFGFAGLYQQRPAPQGGGLIKVENWKLFPPSGQEEEWKRDGVICWPPFEFVVASVDLAYTEKQENDYSALTMWGLWRDKTGAPKIVAIHAWQARLSFNPLVMRIGNNCRKFRPDILLVESKASGISVAQELRRVFGSGDWSTVLVNPRGDKVNRIVSVQGLFEEGLIYAPEREWAQMLIDQVSVFPKGKHDDLVDSMSQALIWMRENGIISREREHRQQVLDSVPQSGFVHDEQPPYDV